MKVLMNLSILVLGIALTSAHALAEFESPRLENAPPVAEYQDFTFETYVNGERLSNQTHRVFYVVIDGRRFDQNMGGSKVVPKNDPLFYTHFYDNFPTRIKYRHFLVSKKPTELKNVDYSKMAMAIIPQAMRPTLITNKIEKTLKRIQEDIENGGL